MDLECLNKNGQNMKIVAVNGLVAEFVQFAYRHVTKLQGSLQK